MLLWQVCLLRSSGQCVRVTPQRLLAKTHVIKQNVRFKKAIWAVPFCTTDGAKHKLPQDVEDRM
eukprot:5697687-Amphidinium_carterae.1